MLFKNMKSGHVVVTTDETSIELMQKSSIYEVVESVPRSTPKNKSKSKKNTAEVETSTDD